MRGMGYTEHEEAEPGGRINLGNNIQHLYREAWLGEVSEITEL